MFHGVHHNPSLVDPRQLQRDLMSAGLTAAVGALTVASFVALSHSPTVVDALSQVDDEAAPLIELLIGQHEEPLDPSLLPEAPAPAPAAAPAQPAMAPQVPDDSETLATVTSDQVPPEDSPGSDEMSDDAQPPPPEDELVEDPPVDPPKTSRFAPATRSNALAGVYQVGSTGAQGGAEAVDPLAATVDTSIEHRLPANSLNVTRRKYPPYPPGAVAIAGIEHRCSVEVAIDTTGRPYEIEVSGCPEDFHDTTRNAVSGWRWVPPTLHGVLVRARTTVEVRYRDFAGGP